MTKWAGRLQVEQVPINKIKVKDRYREDLGDLTDLIESIKEKGVFQPITLDQHLNLVAGERRLRASVEAGLEEIPALVRFFSDKIDRLEVELMENTCRKDMRWDERARLERSIFELKKANDKNWSTRKQAELTDTSQRTVVRRRQVAEALELMPELKQYETEVEAFKALNRLVEEEAIKIHIAQRPPEVVEAHKLADSHYIVGNALEGIKQVEDNSCDFCEVDPPYAVALGGHKNRSGGQNASMIEYNEVKEKDYGKFLDGIIPECYRVLKPDTYMVFWFGFAWFTDIRKRLEKAGFAITTIPAVWYKGPSGSATQPDITLASCYEQFFVARKGSPKLAIPGRGNVFEYHPVPHTRKYHPTQRPIELMEDVLRTFCFPGSTVISPFLGSGATLRACYRLGHTGFGWDLSEEMKQRFLIQVAKDLEIIDK